MESAEIVLEVIKERAEQLNTLLIKTNVIFKSGINSMRTIISDSGTNWSLFESNEKKAIHRVFLTAQLIKGIIDTPLLDEDGAITQQSKELLETGQDALDKIKAQKIL